MISADILSILSSNLPIPLIQIHPLCRGLLSTHTDQGWMENNCTVLMLSSLALLTYPRMSGFVVHSVRRGTRFINLWSSIITTNVACCALKCRHLLSFLFTRFASFPCQTLLHSFNFTHLLTRAKIHKQDSVSLSLTQGLRPGNYNGKTHFTFLPHWAAVPRHAGFNAIKVLLKTQQSVLLKDIDPQSAGDVSRPQRPAAA